MIKGSPNVLREKLNEAKCNEVINTHRWTLFFTIYVSILQGSLLTYTCGCTLWGAALPPLLYFIRIFSDLLGRPLALLPRPSCFNTINKVFYGSIIRCLFSIYFFNVIRGIARTPEKLNNTLTQSLLLVLFQVQYFIYY
jgi:hypothetical protein